ncbi:hypothetical protein ABPG75_009043 [Micractinium tetrahymenae]
MAGAEEGCEAGAAAELAEEGALACLDAASLAQTTQLQSSGAAGGAGATPPAPLRPDDEDAELEAAALALDQHSQLLRRDLLARLLDWKRRAGEQQAALEAAGSRAAAEIAELRSEQQAAKAQLEKQQEVQRRMGHALHRSALWRRHRTLASAAWRAWREHIQRQRRLQRQLQVGARYYGAKAQAAAAAAAEQHLQEAAGAASQQTQRLAEVEAALAAALQARAELEQGMRRAFMRGVCALNLEAMALMKPGGAGAEPAASAAGAPVQEQAQAQQPAAAGTAAANSGASLDGAAADSGLTMQQQQLAALMMQTPVAAGGPPLQVSRRSLAGQQHGMAAGKRVSGVQAVVVRGAAAGVQAAQQGYER